MAHFLWSVILIGYMQGHVTHVDAYTDNLAGLTSFPTDIPAGETEIILKNNLLTVITSIGIYPNLETLDLSSNILNTFPDCANITWLKNLYLNGNQLTTIPYALLDQLTELEVLKLRSNLLTSFPNPPGPGGTLTTLNLDYNSGLGEIPDFSQVGKALQKLYISGCGISSVPVTKVEPLQNLTTIFIHSSLLTELPDFRPLAGTLRTVYLAINQIERVDDNILNQLPNLESLNLAMNPLESLPNPCKRGSAYHSNYSLSLTDTNPLVCDRRARWLLAAQRSGMTVDLSMPCLSPQQLAGTPLQDVAWEDFYLPNGECLFKVVNFVIGLVTM